MANALEFIMKLVDQLSPAMKAAATVTDSASARITSDMEKITGKSRVMGASLTDLKTKLDQVNSVRMNTRIADQFASATREARKLEDQIGKMENRGRGGGIIGGLGGMLGGLGLAAAGGAMLKAGNSADMSKTGFSTLLGSKEEGNAMYSQLNQFANETVFDNAGIYKNAETLLAFGTSGDKVMKTMKMLGDVSMGNQDKMNSLTLAFAQVGSAGKLSGQDLLQFVNAGFNPLNEIAKATGISMPALRKKMEDGAISSDMVTAAFERATGQGGMFNNALVNAAETIPGKWGIFMGGVQTRLIELYNFLKPAIKAILDFGGALLANGPALFTIASVISILIIAIKGAAWATQIWTFVTGIFNAVMAANPIVLVIGLIALLVAGVVYAYNKFGWFRGAVQGAWEGIKAFGQIIKDFVIDRIKGMISGITGIGETLMYFFKGEWSKAWETGKKAANNLIGIDSIKNAIDNGKKIGQAVKAGYNNGVAEIAGKEAANAKKGSIVDPITANLAGKGDVFGSLAGKGKGDPDGSKSRADNINGGGNRPVTINIGKLIEKIEMHVLSAKEGAEDVAKMVREEIVRTLYSVNSQSAS